MTRSHRLWLVVVSAVLVAAPARALPLLSEVFYDASGADGGLVFVEIFGAPGTSLEGFVVEGVNGFDGEVTVRVVLSGAIPADGLVVLGAETSGGGSGVPGADLVADFDLQNGPDSVILRDPEGGVADALGYGDFDSGEVFAGEGTPAPDAPAGSSLARRFADVDTDDNAADFAVLETPSPGSAPLAVPEPGPRGLAAVALAVVGALRWCRRARSEARLPCLRDARPAVSDAEPTATATGKGLVGVPRARASAAPISTPGVTSPASERAKTCIVAKWTTPAAFTSCTVTNGKPGTEAKSP